jgi:hypothetical protein
MNSLRNHPAWSKFLPPWLALLLMFGLISVRLIAAGATNIFSTGFEPVEPGGGYNPDLTLAGQNGWVSDGTGGNGLVTNFFDGLGQQAFVGFVPPTSSTTSNLIVWKPINFIPDTNAQPVVKFSVIMAIIDSTGTNYDDFRWSVYNSAGKRLFTIDFDNNALLVSYALDDGVGFTSTGTKFTNSTLYELVITMNFARNLWTASLNNVLIVDSKLITTAGSALNLGDVDAVWAIRTPGTPGDNYMLFDNYTLTADTATSIPPRLESIGHLANGQFLLRLHGEPGASYAVEATANFGAWTSLKTNGAPDGVFEFLDTSASAFATRFYRARLVR